MQPDITALYRRTRGAALITARDRILAVPEGRRPTRIPDLDPDAGARLWAVLNSPLTVPAAARAAGILESVAETAIRSLEKCGAVEVGLPGDDSHTMPGVGSQAPPGAYPCGRMVLGITGSAQAAFTPTYVRRLLAVFTRELDVTLTESARHFVVPLALSTLGARVWTDPLPENEESEASCLELAEAADLVLVLPATAETIACLALGLCDNTISCIVAQTRAPVLVAPSMNPIMWTHPAVQQNVTRCRELGLHVLEPGPGHAVADGQPGLGAVGFTAFGTGLIALLRVLLEETS